MFCAQTRSFTCATLILLNACVLFACKSHATNSTEALAKHELGPDFRIELNESKMHALCQQTIANDHVNSVVKFVVIRISENMIIKKGSFQTGYVKWVSNESIEIATSDKFSPTLKKETIQIILN